ncbi:MAG: Re/Si-specific NAD(P)(+) transhydrogenase subunit alpha [Solirubrobacteraceae bacterium]|nr:MAG: Re/Si-specific NAD(P)(+) transhydrogenase subunit alpha [Solirubrobacterales bacterium]
MRIAVVRETAPGERRVALVPEVIRKLVSGGHQVAVERGAGAQAMIPDELFTEAGASIDEDPSALWGADVVVKVAPPSAEEIAHLNADSVLVGFLSPLTSSDTVTALAASGATGFALEAVPRISRAQSIDALSSQSNVAGYRAVLLGANLLGRFFPMLMTAAGTVRPAKVLVLGAGVAGLQAIATARRLGAVVQGFDVRAAVKEQVESLGATFLELDLGENDDAEGAGGYAKALSEDTQRRQQEALADAMTDVDVVITTALIPGRPAPLLVTEDAVARMKPGAVVVDLAAEAGGNCARSTPGETVVVDDVTVAAPFNLPSSMPEHASQLYARNIQSMLDLLCDDEGRLALDFDDEIVAGACVTRGGEVVHPGARATAGLPESAATQPASAS